MTYITKNREAVLFLVWSADACLLLGEQPPKEHSIGSGFSTHVSNMWEQGGISAPEMAEHLRARWGLAAD